MSVVERIHGMTKIKDDCWEWQGHIGKSGYGKMQMGSRKDNSRRTINAHRVSYEAFVGPVPEGLVLDHLCRNRSCVNPNHLEPVTASENIRRGEAGRHLRERTHCPAGHPYSGDNLILNKGTKFRRCRECTNKNNLSYYHRKKLLT